MRSPISSTLAVVHKLVTADNAFIDARLNYETGSMSFSLGDRTVGRLVKDEVLH